MIKTYFNSTNSPVTVDEEGHIIAGGEWGSLDSTEPSVKHAVKAGWLVVVKEPEEVKPASPAAEAFKETTKAVEATEAKKADDEKKTK